MDPGPGELLRTLGRSARVWVGAGRHEVHEEWWLALSGEANADFNLACCWSASTLVLTEYCLRPVLDQAKPGIIMLVGAGLASAQTLVDAGWVSVGAMPLMLLRPLSPRRRGVADARPLVMKELSLARELLADAFGLDQPSAAIALPDSVVESDVFRLWGLFDFGRLMAIVTIVREKGLAVVWSMATRRESQGQGLGRQLLEEVLRSQFDEGVAGSLLSSSKAGEKLYRGLGYSVVDYLQLWSRPRWVLGSS